MVVMMVMMKGNIIITPTLVIWKIINEVLYVKKPYYSRTTTPEGDALYVYEDDSENIGPDPHSSGEASQFFQFQLTVY